MEWPKLDWPKLDLAKIGRAKTTMTKNGLAKIGQIRMAKTRLAKVGPFPICLIHLNDFLPVAYWFGFLKPFARDSSVPSVFSVANSTSSLSFHCDSNVELGTFVIVGMLMQLSNEIFDPFAMKKTVFGSMAEFKFR